MVNHNLNNQNDENRKLQSNEIISIRNNMRELSQKVSSFLAANQALVDDDDIIKVTRAFQGHGNDPGVNGNIVKLNIEILKALLTDLEEPGRKIEAAISELNQVLNDINRFNQVLEAFVSIAEIFATIAVGVTSGFTPASINLAFTNLNNLLGLNQA
ncbi:MAG: hypothetical protein QNJ18_16390 [Xenococcaceae cyanobacterium MO_167.B52]|nr:hypothetical protein [Xenococcaceae cyanobacterium MO_167.B52]